MPPREPSTSPPPHAKSADGPAVTAASAGSAADGPDVTGLLIAWSEGDRAALDALLPVVYADVPPRLHAVAARPSARNFNKCARNDRASEADGVWSLSGR